MLPRLLGDGDPTCGPFPLAAGLGLTGFFFSLLQPMLGMVGQPAIWQQGFQGSRVVRSDGRNPTQHIGQVRPHVNAVPPHFAPACRAWPPPVLPPSSLPKCR